MSEFRKIKPISWNEEVGAKGKDPDKIKHYPDFHIDLSHLPEAKDWEIGKEYTVALKLKMGSMNIRNEKEGRGTGSAGFDIVGIKVEENNNPNPGKKRGKRYA